MSGTADNKWLVAASVAFGSLMATIDASIVNVAIPHIRGSVGATLAEITWVSTAYIVATVLIMPLTGFLGSLFGQKRVYLVSLVVFLAGSVLCGTARSLTALIVYRAIQGLGAGSLQPTQQTILRQTFPPEEQGMAMAIFAMVIMIGPALGPTLGGWITDTYSWPWIFYVNLPVGLMGILMVANFVHEPEDIREANRRRAEAQRGSMDWAGIALLCVGVSALQYTLEEGAAHDWFESPAIVAGAFVAVVTLAAFVIRELTAPVPAVNLRLFRDRTFMAGTVIGGVQFAMLMGSMFLLPVFMQELMGYDATQSGLLLMPRTAIMMVAVPIVGRLYNRVQPAVFVALGVVLFAVGAWQLSHLTLATSPGQILIPMLVTGVAFSCLFVPLTTAALSGIRRHELADASGLNSFIRQIAGSVGLTIFTTLLTRYGVQARSALAESVTALRPETVSRLAAVKAGLMARGLDAAAAQHGALRALEGGVALQGTVLAFEKTFLLQGIAFLVALPMVWFLRVDRKQPAAPIHAVAE